MRVSVGSMLLNLVHLILFGLFDLESYDTVSRRISHVVLDFHLDLLCRNRHSQNLWCGDGIILGEASGRGPAALHL